jgi:hypothetical protein
MTTTCACCLRLSALAGHAIPSAICEKTAVGRDSAVLPDSERNPDRPQSSHGRAATSPFCTSAQFPPFSAYPHPAYPPGMPWYSLPYATPPTCGTCACGSCGTKSGEIVSASNPGRVETENLSSPREEILASNPTGHIHGSGTARGKSPGAQRKRNRLDFEEAGLSSQKLARRECHCGCKQELAGHCYANQSRYAPSAWYPHMFPMIHPSGCMPVQWEPNRRVHNCHDRTVSPNAPVAAPAMIREFTRNATAPSQPVTDEQCHTN